MPLSPILDRQPTAADLAPYIARYERWMVDDAVGRPLIIQNMAELSWRADVRRADPNAFLVPYASSVTNYGAYLRSPEWQNIRRRKLAAVVYDCECCGHQATQVHHRDYRPRVLSGEDLSPLVALCRQCHYTIEYDDAGRKRDLWRDKERILAMLMAERECLAPRRNKRLERTTTGKAIPSEGLQTKAEHFPKLLQSAVSSPDAFNEQFKARRRDRQREHRRLKRLGGGNSWEGRRIEDEKRRSKMSPYALGKEDAMVQKSAVEIYNTRPPGRCPFAKGTLEETEYDRGWTDAMHETQR